MTQYRNDGVRANSLIAKKKTKKNRSNRPNDLILSPRRAHI